MLDPRHKTGLKEPLAAYAFAAPNVVAFVTFMLIAPVS